MDNPNTTDNLMEAISASIAKELDNMLIEGLRLKGYEFKDRPSLIEFMEQRVIAVEFSDSTVYYVDNEAFLQYVKSSSSLETVRDMDKVSFSFIAGYYKYIK